MPFCCRRCPAATPLQHLMPRIYPPGLGPLGGVPRTGPSPVMARVPEWLRVVARWEGFSNQVCDGWRQRCAGTALLGL